MIAFFAEDACCGFVREKTVATTAGRANMWEVPEGIKTKQKPCYRYHYYCDYYWWSVPKVAALCPGDLP